MRVRTVSKLFQAQDVCLFCSFRQFVEAQTSRRPFLHQSRSYQSTPPSRKPAAGAAVARKEEELEEEEENDFPMLQRSAPAESRASFPYRNQRSPLSTPVARRINPLEVVPDWKCSCGHLNLSSRDVCSICYNLKSFNPQAAYPSDQGTPLSSRRSPSRTSGGTEWSFARTQTDRNSRGSQWGYNANEYGAPRRSAFDGRQDPNNNSQAFFEQPGTTQELSRRSSPRWRRDPRSLQGQAGASKSNSGREPLSIRRIVSAPGAENDALSSTSFENATNTRSIPRSPMANNGQGIGVFRGLDQLESAVDRKKPGTFGGSQFPRNNRSFDSRNSRRATPFAFPSPDTDQGRGGELYSVNEPESVPESDQTARGRKGLSGEKADRRSQRFDLDEDDGSAMQSTQNRKKTKAQKRDGMQDVNLDDMDDFLEEARKWTKTKKQKRAERPTPKKPQVQLPEFISVEKLAQALKIRLESFLDKLEEEGFEGARYDHILDAENSALFADLYGFEPVFGEASTIEDLVARTPAEDKSLLPPRPPIVTIMGHVDHGKTTILDWLRKSSVVESEHGGITQHIGAFSFTMPGSDRQITFLDTPGHAAFLDMRRRGANVTDIVVLVVAADDSVKPQTIEAIKHALDAKVQIIVAINKIDKADANAERVKQDLAKHDITVEDYGGEYQAIALSGKTGQGMADLEEAILTLADVSDFRAEVDLPAEGWVLESKVTIAGRVATVLVRRGTLRVGDIIVAGTIWARVRTLRNDAGNLVDEATPGTPVQVDGWRGDPSAGLEVLGAESEEQAKMVVEMRTEKEESLRAMLDTAAINASRTEEAEARAKVLEQEAELRRNFVPSVGKKYLKIALDNEGWVESSDARGPIKVHFVIKADVAGSVEALVTAVSAIGNKDISANVVHSGPGLVTESDIRHLAVTGETSYVISFNQPIENAVVRLAEAAGVQILDHNIIYKVTDDVKAKLSDALPPLVSQKVLGEAEIGQIFEISTKKGKHKIAGCRISNGTVDRSHRIRVLRGGALVYTGTLESLKNVKKDVTEMRKGQECGMGFDKWSDFEVGDQIQCFETIEEKRKLY